MSDKEFTHDAYALKREGPRGRGSLIKIGAAIISSEPGAVHFIKIDALPVGGFNGNLYLHPKGVDQDEKEPNDNIRL